MSTTGGPNVVEDGLVLALDAANQKSYPGSGTTWNDLSGNGNNGTLVNGPTFDSGNLGSIEFDGVDDYINLSGNSQWTMFASPGDDFSISCIIQPKSIGSDQALVSQRHGDRMSLWLMSNGKVTFEMDDTRTYVGTNTVLQNNTWYNVTIAFYNNSSESFVEYYINGKFERSEGKWDGNGSGGGSDLWIGWQSRTNYGRNPSHFTGNIPQVSIYNRALTADEVLQNFNATKSRYGL
jgi:hypothetical protein